MELLGGPGGDLEPLGRPGRSRAPFCSTFWRLWTPFWPPGTPKRAQESPKEPKTTPKATPESPKVSQKTSERGPKSLKSAKSTFSRFVYPSEAELVVLAPRDHPERQLWALGPPKSEKNTLESRIERKNDKNTAKRAPFETKSAQGSQKKRKRAEKEVKR